MRRWLALCGTRRARAFVTLACLAAMLIATNILAARVLPQRLDLTAERLYTLSRGTRDTLARIDEPITLRFYYSARLGEAIPAYGVYAQRVHELLDQYVAEAHGKLRLEIHQPLPFSEDEDRALALGLQAVPLNAQGEQILFGLAGTNSTDDQQTIAFFAPERERLLEYDLTRVVHALAFPKRPVVGLLSFLPLDTGAAPAAPGQAGRPMAVLTQLRQLYDVETLPPVLDAIPAGTDVLMLVHPQPLPEKTLFAIDQFVLQGGRAIVFVDPYSELEARAGDRPGGAVESGLPRLFSAWGLRLLPNVVAADRRNARRVVVPTATGTAEPRDYVAWLNLDDGSLNRNDVITGGLRQVTMASAGIIEPLPTATTSFDPLITTSPDAMQLPVAKVAGLPDVAALLAEFKPDDRSYVLAAHITGPVATAFPAGPPPPSATAEAAAQPGGDFLSRSVRPINVVVAADTDLLDDRFWARSEDLFGHQVVVPVAGNNDFVANAIEVLAGGQDLVDLRSRGTSARPFALVERLQRDADERYAAERAALEKRIEQAQAKLRASSKGGPADAGAALAPEEARTGEQFRTDLLSARRQLRAVQAALRHDIEALKMLLEFCDIALVPIVVAALAVVVGLVRRKRWRRHALAAAVSRA